MLQILEGSVYTGCDLNTNEQDMRYLAKHSPYVLAGIGSEIDPSEATASGVCGTILGALGSEANDTRTEDNIQHQRFLLHGIGKVGLAVAQRLKARGASILSYDIRPERANHAGFQNVSDCSLWWTLPFDVLVLCSASSIVTPAMAQQLSCQTVVGSANKPFSDTKVVSAILNSRGIWWIPDIRRKRVVRFVSSAGAVISDSIEHYAPDVFRRARPAAVYAFISQLTYHKTTQLLAGHRRGTAMADMLTRLIYPTELTKCRKNVGPLCGLTFQLTQSSSLLQAQHTQEEYPYV